MEEIFFKLSRIMSGNQLVAYFGYIPRMILVFPWIQSINNNCATFVRLLITNPVRPGLVSATRNIIGGSISFCGCNYLLCIT